MTRKQMLYSAAGLIVAIIVLDGAVSLYRASDRSSGPLDLSMVSKIRVTGMASNIEISADQEAPYTAELFGERRGWGAIWHSGWFADGCPSEGSMRIDGDTLLVDVGEGSRFFDWSDCEMTLSANLRSDAAVMIDQQASRSEIRGDFSVLQIRSDAGDVRFTGHAEHLSLSGAALRARLVYDKVRQSVAIAISGKMLDATVTCLVPTPVSYAVEAVASYVDSALPNTPGAKPEILIRGEMARVRIE